MERDSGSSVTSYARGPLERLILDTSLLIAVERSGATLDELVQDDQDVVIAAITAAELLVGVELGDSRRRERHAELVDDVLNDIPVEPYDLAVARSHAVLLAHTRRTGRPRGAHDLIVAATAHAHGRTVVTHDPRGFADLPGVVVRAP